MYCQMCGKEIPDDSGFCPECGAKVEPDPFVETNQQDVAASEPVDVNQQVEVVAAPQKITQQNEQSIIPEGMKPCTNCGAPIPADSRFCPECRTKQGDNAPMPQMIPASQPRQAYNPQMMELSPEEQAKIKKRNKIIGIVFAALVAVCVIIGVLATVIKPTINLNDYLTVSAEGYDTVGRAIITFGADKFERDYEDKLSSASDKKSRLSQGSYEEAALEFWFNEYDEPTASATFLSKCVSGKVDHTDGLSNGDVLTYKWKCNDDFALDTYGVKLKYEDVEYTVEGLEEAQTFDPFDGIEVSFSGIAPDGRAEISGYPTDKAAENFRYDIDRRNGLSVGDTVTVTASMYYADDLIQYCIENYGKIPSETSKTYTVEGLDSYIRSIDQVSEDSLKEMQSQANDVYNAKIVSNWDGATETLKGFSYIGMYLLTAKNSDTWGNDDVLYLIYKVTVNDKYSNDGKKFNKNTDFYWYIAYKNILVNDKGETTVNVTDYSTPGDRFTIDSEVSSGWWSTKEWYYYGYETIDSLNKAVITSNADSYHHEESIDESLAPAIEMEEEEEEVGEEGVIFPNSSDEIISESDIDELTDEELRYAINELYARHGYIFKDDELRTYYNQFDWYEEKVKPGDFTMSLFNDVERKNVEAMQKERDSRN